MTPEVVRRIDGRREVLRRIQSCWRASREARSRILDELQAITGFHRKSLVRLLRGDLGRKQPGPTYGLKVREAVRLSFMMRGTYTCPS